jgi:predicted flap endonuclease-1-like 5' DNA nuclease
MDLKVRLKNTVMFKGQYFDAGTELDLPEDVANSLVESNSAIIIEIPASKEAEIRNIDPIQKMNIDGVNFTVDKIIVTDATKEDAENAISLDEDTKPDTENIEGFTADISDGESDLKKIAGLSPDIIDTLEAYGIISLQDLLDTPDEDFEGIPGLAKKDVAYLKKQAKKIMNLQLRL